VALTRELGKNEKLRARLAELRPELATAELPCIAHAAVPTAAEVAPALSAGGGFDYVIITSPEAADTFLRLVCEAFGGVEATPTPLRAAAVGDATAAVLEAGGVEVAFRPSRALGKVLAAELPAAGGNRVLYPASARAATTIQEGLAGRGFEVTRINTYDTVPADWGAGAAEAAAQASVVTFASPSAVKVWTERVPRARDMPVACIGETSAKRCRELGYANVHFPDKPGIDGWAETILKCVAAVETKTA